MHLLETTAARAIRYLRELEERAVAPSPDAVARLERFDEPLPGERSDPERVIQLLDEAGSPATMAMAGPRFFGFVIGGVLPAPLAATWLAAAWDQNSALHEVTPGTATIERIALEWLVDLLRLPPGTAGGFVTGATVANFTALAAARGSVLRRAGWDVEADGLFGAPEITVVVGEEVHPTLLKSLGLLGLGRARVVRVPADGQGRMRPEALPGLDGPTIVCAQAGNVNTGAFDPVGEICDVAHDAGAWVHVDGAFGLWAAASPAHAHLVSGTVRADSWATDCHKWLNVPYDSGVAFVRDPDALRSAMAITAEYLPTESAHRNPSDHTPELSRRARGVEVWAALRQLGRSGAADLVERCCAHARRFAEGLREAGHEVLNDVVLNQVLVAFGDAERTRRVIARIQDEGTCWCGGTEWQGRAAMRISVSSWATTEADVERSLEARSASSRRPGTRSHGSPRSGPAPRRTDATAGRRPRWRRPRPGRCRGSHWLAIRPARRRRRARSNRRPCRQRYRRPRHRNRRGVRAIPRAKRLASWEGLLKMGVDVPRAPGCVRSGQRRGRTGGHGSSKRTVSREYGWNTAPDWNQWEWYPPSRSAATDPDGRDQVGVLSPWHDGRTTRQFLPWAIRLQRENGRSNAHPPHPIPNRRATIGQLTSAGVPSVASRCRYQSLWNRRSGSWLRLASRKAGSRGCAASSWSRVAQR
jgi:glutamate/tyrosine decarboxylase-like PLP-dependent enzyme